MKIVGKVLILGTMLCWSTTASAGAGAWGLGAGVLDGDFGFQARKDFWLGGDISQITAQASVYFHSKTTFRLDADYHFVINADDPSRFYPLAGLQFAFNSDDVKFGINAGGGVNFMFTDKLAAFAEAKYVFGSWDGWALVGGIYF